MDEAALASVLATYVEAWNAHDLIAWSQLFTDDADYVSAGTGWWASKRDNVDGHTRIHDKLVQQKQRMAFTATMARVARLSPDIALVHATWEWPRVAAPSGAVRISEGIILMVMVQMPHQSSKPAL